MYRSDLKGCDFDLTLKAIFLVRCQGWAWICCRTLPRFSYTMTPRVQMPSQMEALGSFLLREARWKWMPYSCSFRASCDERNDQAFRFCEHSTFWLLPLTKLPIFPQHCPSFGLMTTPLRVEQKYGNAETTQKHLCTQMVIFTPF